MSKEPETKDAEGPRKRRGGLRVPSDSVPRRAGSGSEISAPVPEAVGLAASISESFGVAGAAEEDANSNGKDPQEVAVDPDDMPTISSDSSSGPGASGPGASGPGASGPGASGPGASDPGASDPGASDPGASDPGVFNVMPGDMRLSTEDEVTHVAPESPAQRPPSDQSEDVDFSVDETSIDDEPGMVPASQSAATRLKRADSTSPGIMPAQRNLAPEPTEEKDEIGDSVDIPFDDSDETVSTEIPQAPGAPNAAMAAAKTVAAPTPPTKIRAKPAPAPAKPFTKVLAETDEEDAGSKKKPRFTRALTMALNESDLEEVRGRTNNDATASPVEEASPVDSADVLADDDMVEISEPPKAPKAVEASARKKRAETAEPPPPPPPAQKAVKVAPKAVPKAPAASPDDAKRRHKKPWFEELFDEDYLRTLPFLTPQATQFEANFVMESLGVDAGAQILDVGCGYGRHAMELAARGYHLVGLDSSLPLLLRGADEAQRRGLTINFVHGDMRDMTFESQFDGAYCLFSSFGYFDDETNKRTAQNIAKALKPGARFVVEVLNRDYLLADLPSRDWWEGDGCVVLEEVEFNYFSSRIVSNRSVVFDDGRQLEHEISLRSFSLHELGKFLHAVGFRVLEISGSMSTRGRFFGAHSRDIVVVAERRATKADEG